MPAAYASVPRATRVPRLIPRPCVARGVGPRRATVSPWRFRGPTGGGVYPHAGARVGFDLIVNELLPGRLRRTGQLVWSGGNGWVWLRGDRQDPSRFGVLELVG